MGNRSLTLLEPHMHGDVHIGPRAVRNDDEAASLASDAGGLPTVLVAVVVALVATAIAIGLAKRSREGS